MTYEPCDHPAAVILWTVSKTVSALFFSVFIPHIGSAHPATFRNPGGLPLLQFIGRGGDPQYPVA